jgi:hypothetical protein
LAEFSKLFGGLEDFTGNSERSAYSMIVLSCFRNTACLSPRALSLFEEGGKRKEEGEYSKHRIVLRMAEGGVDLGYL